QAEDGLRDCHVTGVQTCALPICFMGFKIKFLCKNVWIFPSEAEFSDFELGNWNNYVKNRAFEPRPWTSDPGACQSELQRWGSDVGGGTSEEGQWASEVGVSHSKSGVWT